MYDLSQSVRSMRGLASVFAIVSFRMLITEACCLSSQISGYPLLVERKDGQE
jgi:hypothetical protein